MKKLFTFSVILLLAGFFTFPAYAQEQGAAPHSLDVHWLALAMAIAAAGCGYAQSKLLAAGCEGVARNPGSVDTVRFFVLLGLAFIEFLALLTFLVVLFLPPLSFLGT